MRRRNAKTSAKTSTTPRLSRHKASRRKRIAARVLLVLALVIGVMAVSDFVYNAYKRADCYPAEGDIGRGSKDALGASEGRMRWGVSSAGKTPATGLCRYRTCCRTRDYIHRAFSKDKKAWSRMMSRLDSGGRPSAGCPFQHHRVRRSAGTPVFQANVKR